MKVLYTFFILFLSSVFCWAQGVRGNIKDQSGEALPFASIFVAQTGSGTSSNADGDYELQLPPGSYAVTFQYLGYAAQTKTVVVKNAFLELDVVLTPQSILLNTVTVKAGQEDPAYTIMRKAIAKAKFHMLQTDRYTAEVYTKGTGQVKDIPWALRGILKEEGIDTSRAFTSESVSEITFERPNTFKERIISIRTSGQNDQNASPNAYITSSFYAPTVVGGISPLSPKSFRYYRFTFMGSFEDRGHIINKIKVTPRSRGELVFDGYIYIRENYWNIHSLDLATSVQGFDVDIAQIFAPITPDIWMPVTQKYRFSGSFMGIDVVYNYLASLSKYDVVANKDLSPEIVVIDEKIEPVPEEVATSIKSPETLKKENKQLTRKDLKKLIKEYEEQEETEETEDVVSDYWRSIDSTARKKDSAYWAEIRPVPLTEREKAGYQVDDSVYVAVQADTARKVDGDAFAISDLLFGNTYKLGNLARFKFRGFLPEVRFNTVEGFNLDFTGTLRWKNDTTLGLRITPNLRYGFSSNQFYGKLRTQFGFGQAPQRADFSVEGGRYINQFNPSAISPFINSMWSLLFARNYMKLYAEEFITATYNQQLGYKYRFSLNVGYANRSNLFNTTDFGFFEPDANGYSPNAPANDEGTTTSFENARAFKSNLSFYAQPWLKFRKVNGQLKPLRNSSPQFRVSWRSGWNNLFGSTVDYQHLEFGFTGAFKLGVKATIDFDAEAGTFVNNNRLLFMDVKHFNGGLTELAPLGLTGNYRLLDYYQYSTQTHYFSVFSHIRFRKFLFTQLGLVRLSGIKENLFVNYLKTQTSPHYTEIGYTIDQVFRIVRIEFVQSFNGATPHQFGVRIGVSSLFEN